MYPIPVVLIYSFCLTLRFHVLISTKDDLIISNNDNGVYKGLVHI